MWCGGTAVVVAPVDDGVADSGVADSGHICSLCLVIHGMRIPLPVCLCVCVFVDLSVHLYYCIVFCV